MPKNYFDERIAKEYEARWPHLFDPAVVDATVSFLADLAGSDAALELGIGTGRIALPLSRRGVPVHGIDLSQSMLAELQTKPGADDIGLTLGDLATTRVDGTFKLVYLLRNTITNLTTQDAQVECFRNVGAHLEPGGYVLGAVSLRMAVRVGPDGTTRRNDVARALERLAPRALHERQPQPRLGLGNGRPWSDRLSTGSAPVRSEPGV
jgi:SAM-dependent methyltransferase